MTTIITSSKSRS